MNKYSLLMLLVCMHSVYGCVEFINDTRLPILVSFDTTLDMWYGGKNLGKRFFAEELILPKGSVVNDKQVFAAWNPVDKKIVGYDGGSNAFTYSVYLGDTSIAGEDANRDYLTRTATSLLSVLKHPETGNTIKLVVGSLKHCIDGWAEKLGYTIWYPDVNKDWSLKSPLQWKSVYFATREGGNRRITVKIILNSEGKPEFSIDTALI